MAGSAKLLLGEGLAARILDDARSEISKLGAKPKIAVVLVGDDEASKVFVGLKEKAAKSIGADVSVRVLASDVGEQRVLQLVDELNADNSVHGILVQLPLPPQVGENAVLGRISPKKDVDGLTPDNMGRLLLGQSTIMPCTVAAILALMENERIGVEGKHIVVINRSSLIGKPLSAVLLGRSATVTVCHTRTKDIESHTKAADIVITATGVPGFLRGEMLKEGAVVIDAGYAKIGGKARGDSDMDSVSKIASAVTPVPGGIGPLTVAMTMRNLLICQRLSFHKHDLRRQKLSERMSASEGYIKSSSAAIRASLEKQPEFSSAGTVFVYVPVKKEVDTTGLINGLIASGKRVVVPVVDSVAKTMSASELKSMDELGDGHFGTLEPKGEFLRPVRPSEIDLSVIPGIAFDANGNRLGYGHGYYDRFLAETDAPVVALAFDFQVVDDILGESHDVRVGKIITEKRVLECG